MFQEGLWSITHCMDQRKEFIQVWNDMRKVNDKIAFLGDSKQLFDLEQCSVNTTV